MRFSTVVFLAPVAAVLLTGVYAKPASVVDDFGGKHWTASALPDNQVPLLPTTAAPEANPYGSLRGTNLRNSGICERRGVDQSTGYVNITTTDGTTKHMWFWFFPARNGNESTPIALWFSGGPGVSSMGAVAARHGPCRVTEDNSVDVVNNPFSWNNEVNMLYIDQPIGTGFSYGTPPTPTKTTDEAAQDVWKFLQVFFQHQKFKKYQSRNLGIWTESYGGHYGPRFSAYILDQNTEIANGRIPGVKLNLKFLGIGNGITDALVQYPGYLTYTKYNPYEPLVPNGVFTSADAFWNKDDNTCDRAYHCKGCKALIKKCRDNTIHEPNEACKDAQSHCYESMTLPLLGRHRNINNIRIMSGANDPNTPRVTAYMDLVRTRIGADTTWEGYSEPVADDFAATGDWVRNSRQHLQRVINSTGIRTLIYAGDADYNINFHTVEALVDALNTQYAVRYKTQEWTTYKVRGQTAGVYKQAGRFSYLRVYGAGHSVPAYDYGSLRRGEAAFQMFNQIMSDASLSSTDSPTGEPDLNADIGCHFGN